MVVAFWLFNQVIYQQRLDYMETIYEEMKTTRTG